MPHELRALTTADVPVLCYGTDGITALTTAQIAAFTTAQITMLPPGGTAEINPTLRSPYTSAIAAINGLALVPLASAQLSALGEGIIRLGAGSTTQAPAWKEIRVLSQNDYDHKYNTAPVNAIALNTGDIPALTTSQVAAMVISELGAVPAASPTLTQALAWLYMKSRNEQTQTATVQTVKNDAGSNIATATVSDTAGTTTRGKFS